MVQYIKLDHENIEDAQYYKKMQWEKKINLKRLQQYNTAYKGGFEGWIQKLPFDEACVESNH